jgi:glycine amidinotransferase
MSIWTNWDPLEEIIVGNCHAAVPVHWELPNRVRELFNQILSETKEDLDSLAVLLNGLGAVVHRPTPIPFEQTINQGKFNIVNATSPIVPRDQYLAYGNTIYQTYTSMPDRYLDGLNYYPVFMDLYNRGYNWISQPPPNIKNFDTNVKWYVDGPRIYGEDYADTILWHTATMFKCGDALITNNLGPGSQPGLEWMRRNTDARIIHNSNTVVNNWGHIDHGFYMSDDETVWCINKRWVPEVLQGKQVIELEGKYTPFNYQEFIAKTHKINDKMSMEWLDEWLGEWKGYAQDVAFEFNVLVVDSHNIVFSTEQPEVFSELNKRGINCHVCKIRHGMFWEAGIHCLTLDVKRRGERRAVV